jgi:hypothetical protein
MSVSRKHGLYAVGLGTGVLGGITQQSIANEAEIKGEITSGQVMARYLAMYAQKIAPNFATQAVATALGLCGTAGLSLGTLTGGMKFYAQQYASGGSRAAGSTHRSFQFLAGLLVPRTLSVEHRGDATLNYDAVVIDGGGGDPVIISDSVALPALTSAGEDEKFTLSTAQAGGVALGEKTSMQIDFGLDVVAESGDSEIWDTYASIRQMQTVLSFKGIDAEWFKSTNVPLAGKAGTHLNTIFYLQKRAHGSTYVAAGTASHIKFTAAGMAYIDKPFDASGNNAAEITLKMPLYFDGTNLPLTVNTASAIT